ncbi:MAG: MaoC/PaaZ C-terminal domain-containing protein [Alphaproteobacteria bacterium]|jgi:acyl dehydratase|nr:MaoC/PaaZ C-terminal domain-containing protein [Alphaproteobacteria bacterium]
MAARYLEEFSVGQVFETEPVTLSQADIIEFARRYDPQVIHTDPEGAKDTFFKGLIASGHQTIGVAFAQFIRLGLIGENSLGGPAMDEVRWSAPVRPGDTLVTKVEVLEIRESKSRLDRGIIRLQFRTMADGQDVSRFMTTTFLRRRPTENAA